MKTPDKDFGWGVLLRRVRRPDQPAEEHELIVGLYMSCAGKQLLSQFEHLQPAAFAEEAVFRPTRVPWAAIHSASAHVLALPHSMLMQGARDNLGELMKVSIVVVVRTD